MANDKTCKIDFVEPSIYDQIDLDWKSPNEDIMGVICSARTVICILHQLEKDIEFTIESLQPERWEENDRDEAMKLLYFQIHFFTTRFPRFRKECKNREGQQVTRGGPSNKPRITYGQLEKGFDEAGKNAQKALNALYKHTKGQPPNIDNIRQILATTFREVLIRNTLNLHREKIIAEIELGKDDAKRLQMGGKVIGEIIIPYPGRDD